MDEDLSNAMSINSRASLVPAAAVIPARVAYFDVVAVKKLVVGWHPFDPRFLALQGFPLWTYILMGRKEHLLYKLQGHQTHGVIRCASAASVVLVQPQADEQIRGCGVVRALRQPSASPLFLLSEGFEPPISFGSGPCCRTSAEMNPQRCKVGYERSRLSLG